MRDPTPPSVKPLSIPAPTAGALSRPAALRVVVLTTFALLGFAANSLLCRGALGAGQADAASYTALRLVSGAAVLWLLARPAGGPRRGAWGLAFPPFAYPGALSFAYLWPGAGG